MTAITDDTAGASASDFVTRDNTLKISGSFKATDTNVLTVEFNGTTYTLGGAGANDGQLTALGNVWTLDVQGTTLADDTYVVTAKAYDVAGNVATATHDVVVDTTAPTTGTGATDLRVTAITDDTAGASASDFITRDRTLLINGSFNTADTNVLTVNFNGTTYTLGTDAALTAASANVWQLNVQSTTLIDGTYTVTATATDKAGNTATATHDVVVDNNPPVVSVTSISDDSGVVGDFITSDHTLIIKGSFNASDTNVLTVELNGTTYRLGSSPRLSSSLNTWTLDATNVALADGIYFLTVSATDLAGNVSPKVQKIEIASPVVPFSSSQEIGSGAGDSSRPIIRSPSFDGGGRSGIGLVSPIFGVTQDPLIATGGAGSGADGQGIFSESQRLGSDSTIGGADRTSDSGFRVMVDREALDGSRGSELKLFHGIPDQTFEITREVLYMIPVDAFVHTNPRAIVSLTALLVGERETALPTWLSFDPAKGEFRGGPPPQFQGDLHIRVVAKDDGGGQVETQFSIRVVDLAGKVSLNGKPSLTAQFRQHGVRGWEADRDRIIRHARGVAQTRVAHLS